MYHLEALLNKDFYEDFESCNFKKNGARMVLDPYETCVVIHKKYKVEENTCGS